jgi:Uma2 family endonuclease
MSAAVLTSVEEYLATSYEDGDREYIDGEILKINVGEMDHSDVQTMIAGWFREHRKRLGVYPLVEIRTQVSPTRFLLPDVAVVLGPRPAGRILTEPPFLIVEVLSAEDRVPRIERKIDDYLRFGVRFIWSIDPETRNGHIYTADRRVVVENGVFWTDDPRIELDLAELSR